VPVVMNLDIIVGLYFKTLSQGLGTKEHLHLLPNNLTKFIIANLKICQHQRTKHKGRVIVCFEP